MPTAAYYAVICINEQSLIGYTPIAYLRRQTPISVGYYDW